MDEQATTAPTWPDPAAVELLSEVWIPVGVPGYSGASKAERAARLDDPSNVLDDSYVQPHTAMNHYQDISVRRVIAELVDDPAWPEVVDSGSGDEELFDVTSGRRIPSRRARGFSGDLMLQPTGACSELGSGLVAKSSRRGRTTRCGEGSRTAALRRSRSLVVAWPRSTRGSSSSWCNSHRCSRPT